MCDGIPRMWLVFWECYVCPMREVKLKCGLLTLERIIFGLYWRSPQSYFSPWLAQQQVGFGVNFKATTTCESSSAVREAAWLFCQEFMNYICMVSTDASSVTASLRFLKRFSWGGCFSIKCHALPKRPDAYISLSRLLARNIMFIVSKKVILYSTCSYQPSSIRYVQAVNS